MSSPGPLPTRTPAPAALWGLAAALVSYNLALNLVPFPAAAYVPANLLLAALALWFGRRQGLTREDVGLGGRQRRGVLIGVGVLILVGAGLLLASRVPAAAPLLTDQRATGLTGWPLVYAAAVRIPLGTAVPEEILFRGVYLALLLRRGHGWWSAAACSSAVFGLWHIGPTVALARVNGLDGSPALVLGMVALSVVITFVAGLVFCLLRRWGLGVAAPILAHVATNSLALLTAVAAQSG